MLYLGAVLILIWHLSGCYVVYCLQGGMAFFGSDPAMVLLYSNFLIDVAGAYQTGHSQLVAAKSLSPSYAQQFAIFVREQQHMQRAQTAASGETAVDLVSYVEFQVGHDEGFAEDYQ